MGLIPEKAFSVHTYKYVCIQLYIMQRISVCLQERREQKTGLMCLLHYQYNQRK